jgi:dihydrofolate reductase
MIRAILACDDDWGIGKDGDLPWPHNPADLKWFKEKTVGGVVAMGKATWDSLPNKPLPKRNNIVVTRSTDDKRGPYHFLTFEQAETHLVSMSKLQNVWIIGGAKLIEGLLPIIEEFHLSRISGTYECDTFLPSTPILENYTLVSSEMQGDVYVDIYRRRDN